MDSIFKVVPSQQGDWALPLSAAMDTIAAPVLMVLSSAVLHAYWNLLVKESGDKTLFSFLYIWSAILVHTPVAVLLSSGGRIPRIGWICIVTTGGVYCLYFLLLARSYELGDLSHSYPITRGLAPGLTVIWALIFLSERPSLTGWVGIVAVMASVQLFNPSLGRGTTLGKAVSGLRQSASLTAVATGICTSAYMVVDKIGVNYVDPVLYIYLTFMVCGVLLSPFYLTYYGPAALRRAIAAEGRKALLVGFLCIFAYLLVLFALRLTQVSYIVSLRSTSILFAAILGFEVLGEQRTARRVLGVAAMVGGVAMIALA